MTIEITDIPITGFGVQTPVRAGNTLPYYYIVIYNYYSRTARELFKISTLVPNDNNPNRPYNIFFILSFTYCIL